jgi:hypothetical protein
VNVENVRREDWVVGGLALLLAIFLVVLPWFDISVGPFSATFSATSTPDGWLGVIALIGCLAIIADLAVENFSPQTQLPVLNSRANTRFVLAVAVAVFVVLKFLFHIHFSLFGWGFYVDVIVTAALVYTALQVRNGAPLPGVGGPTVGGGPRGGAPVGGPATPPAGGTTPPAPGAPPAGEPGGGSTPPPRV